MESKEKQNGQSKVANSVGADKTPKFVAGNPVNALSESQVAKDESNDLTKRGVKFSLEGNLTLNLEQTLKKIKELNRLSINREKLIATIDKLEDFEIKQLDEVEETSLNHFQRCELRITDDNGNLFTTKNPFIIDQVAASIKVLCTEKLAEVESQISLNL